MGQSPELPIGRKVAAPARLDGYDRLVWERTTVAWFSRIAHFLEDLHRIEHAFRRFFVLEVGEDIAAGGEMLANAAGHRPRSSAVYEGLRYR